LNTTSYHPSLVQFHLLPTTFPQTFSEPLIFHPRFVAYLALYIAAAVTSYDKSSLEYIKNCTGLLDIKDLVGKKHCSFIDKLISDVRFSNLLLVYGSNAL